MTKKELRKIYKEKRQALTMKEAIRMDDLLLIQFQQWPLYDITTILSFWPIDEKTEVNTHLMLDYLSFRIPGLQVAYPVISASENLFTAIAADENTQFVINEYGILEPESEQEIPPGDIDAVFVPLLAFDLRGYRVGYGKGFYDRFLHQCRTDVLKIGFSYFEPEPAIDDISEFDVPLSICVTPNKIYEF
jgi:5-formyltetrahydrofolate cyclo-ligase